MWRVVKRIRASGFYARKRVHSDAPRLLERRLRLLRLEPAFMAIEQPDILRRLANTCGNCAHTDACAADLAVNDVAAGMDSYCANGETLDELVIKRATG
jgi:hypothetical protein